MIRKITWRGSYCWSGNVRAIWGGTISESWLNAKHSSGNWNLSSCEIRSWFSSNRGSVVWSKTNRALYTSESWEEDT